MAEWLSKAQVEFAVDPNTSVRQAAKELGCSPSSVHRLRAKNEKGELFEDLAKAQKEQERLDFVAAMLSEAFRLSRYPVVDLVRILETTRTPGPMRLRESALMKGENIPIHRLRKALKNNHCIKLYSERKKQKKMTYGTTDGIEKQEETASQASQTIVQRQRPPSGTYAVHRIPVQWINPEGMTCRADVLAVLERASGILVIRVYPQLLPNGITKTLTDAYALTHLKVDRYIFVGTQVKPLKGKTVTKYRAAATGDTADRIAEMMKEKWHEDFEVEVECPIGSENGLPIFLPWKFRDFIQLNSIIQQWAANYNCGYKNTTSRATAIRSEPSPVDILYKYQGLECDLERSTKKKLRKTVAAYRRKPRRRSRIQQSTNRRC